MINKSVFVIMIILINIDTSISQTLCINQNADQKLGIKDGYRYELWNQNSQGTACMSIDDGALFSGYWNNIENYLARRGLGYNQTKNHEDIGDFHASYACNYNPSKTNTGNSYLAVYGWTVNPLIEYYIIEDWRNWIASMSDDAIKKGSIKTNGSVYDIYEKIRHNKPSIIGTSTFKQYFSIRRNTRNSGNINISKHFNAWQKLGMDMGLMHEVSFVVEGYKNKGDFKFTHLDIKVN